MQHLGRILEASDAGFDGGRPPDATLLGHLQEPLDESYLRLVLTVNGLYAFNTSLHLYGWNPALPFHDIVNRNRPHPWRITYGKLAGGLTFFAEDVFGNQFAFSRKGVLVFDVETGDKKLIAQNFDGWLAYIDQNTDYASGRPLATRWSSLYGPIPYGHHLCPKKPFVIGGDFAVDNLYLLEWEKSLELRADIARQIQDLPEGAPVVLRTSH